MISKKVTKIIGLIIAILITTSAVYVTGAKTGKANQMTLPKKVVENKMDKASNTVNATDDSKVNNRLKEFSKKDIDEARLLVNRVIYQLDEILSTDEKPNKVENSNNTNNSTSEAMIDSLNKKEDAQKDKELLAKYQDLKNKIDADQAIWLILKLKKDFGGLEGAMNEYLYSLQLGIDLNSYIKDKKLYEKQRKEKSSVIDANSVITLSRIDEKALEKIQKQNEVVNTKDYIKDVKRENNGKLGDGLKESTNKSKDSSELLPEVKDIKPENPRDDAMKEINEINKIKEKSFNPGN